MRALGLLLAVLLIGMSAPLSATVMMMSQECVEKMKPDDCRLACMPAKSVEEYKRICPAHCYTEACEDLFRQIAGQRSRCDVTRADMIKMGLTGEALKRALSIRLCNYPQQ